MTSKYEKGNIVHVVRGKGTITSLSLTYKVSNLLSGNSSFSNEVRKHKRKIIYF